MNKKKVLELGKEGILTLLEGWVKQRSGMDFRDYGNIQSYRGESRSITRDLRDFKKLLQALRLSSIDAELLKESFRAFSGRLSIIQDKDGSFILEYCTGQYFPTEYRKAACAVLAAALWDYYRSDFTGDNLGDQIRSFFVRKFGRAIASRWFN